MEIYQPPVGYALENENKQLVLEFFTAGTDRIALLFAIIKGSVIYKDESGPRELVELNLRLTVK